MKKLISLIFLLGALCVILASCVNKNNHTHNFDSWDVVVPPTCTTDGLSESVCDCGETKTETIPATGHTFINGICTECNIPAEEPPVEEPPIEEPPVNTDCSHENTTVLMAVEPRCGWGGLTEGSLCLDCSTILVAQQKIPALEHEFTNYEPMIPVYGVCLCTWVKEYISWCNRGCGATNIIVDTTEPRGHVWGEYQIVTAPTPTSYGYIERECFDCSCCKSGIDLYPLTQHYVDEGIYTLTVTDPDCINEGNMKYGFVVNGLHFSFEVIIPANGHTYKDGFCEVCHATIAPGLYDDNYNLVASWDELVNVYGMDAEKDYGLFDYNSVSSNPSYLIDNNSALTEGTRIVIGEVEKIGERAFYSCDSLISAIITEGVVSIKESAFTNCDRLEYVYIPSGLNKIENGAFFSAKSMLEYEVADGNSMYKDIDGNLYSIDGKTLVYYAVGKKDASFDIPYGVNTIGTWAFDSAAYIEQISIPDSVQTIGGFAFNDCKLLASIVIPESVRKIDQYAFQNCTSLKSVIISEGVEIISRNVFKGCTALTSINIPASVTSIGTLFEYGLFEGCKSLIEITVSEESEHFMSIDGNLYSKDGKILYEYASGKTDTTFTVPDGVEKILWDAFKKCQNIQHVILPDSVTYIDNHAFSHSSIKSVTITKNVKTIGDYAFSSCTNLTDVYYTGTAEEWADMTIESNNTCLTSATIHYNYIPE